MLFPLENYKAEVRNGRLYGRYVTDMKGGLAALIIVLLEFLESDMVPENIKLFATVGEENGEYDAAQLVKAGYVDNLSGLLIAEPANEMKELGIFSKGVIDYTATSIGKVAHSSKPEMGVNVIDELVDFANKFRSLMSSFDKVEPTLGN